MQDTHNELSADELKVISDTEFYRLKREITHKLQGSLAVLGETISEILQKHSDRLPKELLTIAPKISQGERYLGLPWLILDYPRIFTGENTFAFRSMFWWGKYFSFTIHISGTYLSADIKRKIADNISILRSQEFYLCINSDPWQHHFENTNYKLLDELSKKETETIIKEATFLKLGRKLPLHSFPGMIEYGGESYKKFLEMIC